MHIHDDFEEFLRLLGERGVEYVIVGGYAVAYISFADLITNKRASGRGKDLVDVDELGGNRGR